MYGAWTPCDLVAAAAGAEGGAEGLALCGCLLVLDLDLRSRALAVDGVVLAVGNVAADSGDLIGTHFLVAHYYLPPEFIVIRQY